MDPVSVIGLLGALCNLIEAGHRLYRIAKTLKDGNSDLSVLCSDVAFFEEALKGFDRILRSRQTRHNISADVISQALEESLATIEQLETLLSNIAAAESPTLRSVKWLQNKSSIKKLHERIKTQSGVLQSFLALAHTETFLNACSQYPQLLHLSSDEVARLEAPWLERPTLSNATNPVSDATPLTPRLSGASSSQTSMSTVVVLQGEIDQADHNGSIGSKGLSGSHFQVDAKGPLVIRKACRFNCFCHCHPRIHVQSDHQIKLEKSFVNLALSAGPCNDPDCEGGRPEKPSQKQIASTSRLYQKALAHIASSHAVKVRYHMNVFRTVAESSDVMRYCKQGNLDKLQSAIQSGRATLWDTAPDGWSLLHTAAYDRQLPVVKYLLEMGADTEAADVGCQKPADLAILNSLVIGATDTERDINKAFAEKDDYISAFDFTPIHTVVLDLYDPTDRERPPLETVLSLLDDCNNAPATTDWSKWKSRYKKRSPVLRNVIEYFRATAYESPKHTKIIHNLIDQGDKSLHWTPLHWACATGKVVHIHTLTYYGADPFILSDLRFNILHAAAESKPHGGLDAALAIWRRFPLKLNINEPNHWGETPLHIAAWGSVENVRRLVEAGADRGARQEDGQVPLHGVGTTSRGEESRTLIELLCADNEGDHINAQDCDGRPPLFDFLDDARCVEMLLGKGARLDLLDEDGRSVFHHACLIDAEQTLRLLLRLTGLATGSVLVTSKDHSGDTPLNTALAHRSKRCALVLLKEVEDLGDVVGKDGWASVHHAAKLGDEEVMGLVVRRREFVSGTRTTEGKTAEVVAMEAGNWHTQVKGLLRESNGVT